MMIIGGLRAKGSSALARNWTSTRNLFLIGRLDIRCPSRQEVFVLLLLFLSVERAAFALVAAFLDPLLATPLAGMIASSENE